MSDTATPSAANPRTARNFAVMRSTGETGVDANDSIVPRSHSRATTTLAKKLDTKVMITTVSPGTRYQAEVLASLNQARGVTVMGPAAAASAVLRSPVVRVSARSVRAA